MRGMASYKEYPLAWVLLFLAIVFTASSQAQSIPKSPNDNREYEYFTLPNQLRVLLVSDPTTDKAAASLDVNVGSDSDPEDRNGLAHFLEHMLFLGTKEYPLPEEYQAFISSHGGSHNAYTSREHTNYFFDVEHLHLGSALDRFSQFFSAPLFTAEYVERERNAVHSEYKSKIKNTYRRELDVYRQLVNPQHPARKFSVGSLQTLADREGDSVREDLLQFYADHYAARNMTLVVLGRESLKELKDMVVAGFSAVPDREVKPSLKNTPLFAEGLLPAQVNIKPVKEERRLSMIFPIPSAEAYYDRKPLQYLGNLLGHEGKGSLYSLLKDKGWAEGLSAGGAMGGSNQGTFQISIQLTEEGLENQDQVVASTFHMIDKVRKDGVAAWRFKEQKQLAKIAFQFAEKSAPIHWVSRLSNQMHRYEVDDTIRGSYAFDHYDSELIQAFLGYLTPKNLLKVTTAPEVDVDKTTSFYQTPYKVSALELDANEVANASWQKLTLPKKNRFIPRNLKLKPAPALEAIKDRPQLIKSNEAIQAWFKQDDQFRVPKASIRIRVYSPVVAEGAKQGAMSHLYAALVNDSLNEFSYPAALAGLRFNLRANSRGFDLEVAGYNDRQGLLLDRMLSVMTRNRFDSDRVERLRRELIRHWRNQQSLTPYEQLFRKAPALLYSPYSDELQMAAELENVSASDLKDFSSKLWLNTQVKVLVFGNLYRQQSLKLAALIERALHRSAESGKTLSPARVVDLPTGVQRYHLQVDHADVAAILYQQAADDTVKDRASMMMIRQMLKSSFYHQLRTQQQLGYIVFMTGMDLKDVTANLLVVQSPSTPLKDVMVAIDQFVSAQTGSIEDFERHRQALLAQLTEAPKNLNGQAGRYWSEIISGTADFSRRQQLINAVKSLQPSGLADYSKRVMGRSDAIWLTASNDSPALAEEQQTSGGAGKLSDKMEQVLDFDAFKRQAKAFVFP